MNQYVLFILTIVSSTTLATGQTTEHISVKILEGSGAPLPNADVVAILKSGPIKMPNSTMESISASRRSGV
jgi:hypothetical protein